MKKVLIFGVAGFVGSYLIDEFSGMDGAYEIYGTDVLESFVHNNMYQYESCNILDSKRVDNLIERVQPDYIINLAALSSVRLSWDLPRRTMEVNVIGALNILDAAMKLASIPIILLVGSSEEYEVSDVPLDEEANLVANNPYGISKMALEQMAQLYCEKYDCRIYFTRSFNHTGVGQKDTFVVPSFCKQIAAIEKSGHDGTIYVGNISAKRDISDVRDIVRAYRLILESGSKERVFNVGSGVAMAIQDILELIIRLCKYQVNVSIDSDKYRPNDNPYICCNNQRLKRETEWQQRYSIEDTIIEMYNYYLNIL